MKILDPESFQRIKRGRGTGRPPHRMLKKAIAIAKKRGGIIPVLGGRNNENPKYEGSPPQGLSRGTAGQFRVFQNVPVIDPPRGLPAMAAFIISVIIGGLNPHQQVPKGPIFLGIQLKYRDAPWTLPRRLAPWWR